MSDLVERRPELDHERMLRDVAGQGPVEGAMPGPLARRSRAVELGLALDRSGAAPLPDQLEQQLRDRFGRGELRRGAVLPSSRALATELGVSRGVVVEAYDRLIRQGLLVAHQGAATRVAELPAEHRVAQGAVAPAAPPEWRLRLHPASTPLGTLDRRAWGAALRTALREASEPELASLVSGGDPGLRAALATQLSRSRGVVASPTDITITGGVTNAIAGLAPVLAARGGRVAVEEPGFVIHRATLRASGLDVVPVPVDDHGLDPGALRGHDVAAVLVTPAHQMPLGVPLSPARRAALVAWARETGTLVLEDDYDGELRYDRKGVRSLHALAPDCVVYMGSTSKVLSPAVRVGWIVTPPDLTGEVQGWRLAAGGSPSALIQLALAQLLRSGAFDRGATALRRRAAAQRAALVEALARVAPDLKPTGLAAGLHLTVRVSGATSWGLVAAAQSRGVELYATDVDGGGALMLVGFGLVDTSAARDVAQDLVEIVRAAQA